MANGDTAGSNGEGQSVALAHELLRAGILAGQIPAGPTSQVALAERLRVGRTPLREAIRMLQREGLVISEPNRRVQIVGLSAADAEELYVMRIALESTAIRITVGGIDSREIAELEGWMAQMDHYVRERDAAGMRAPHLAFHRGLVVGAGPRVGATIDRLFDHAERYRIRFGATTPEIWARRRGEHRAILDAVGEGDARLAARRLVEHYVSTVDLVLAAVDPGYEPRRLALAVELITK